jgi:hypothetical protein
MFLNLFLFHLLQNANILSRGRLDYLLAKKMHKFSGESEFSLAAAVICCPKFPHYLQNCMSSCLAGRVQKREPFHSMLLILLSSTI